MTEIAALTRATLARRLAAAVYDGLLLSGILFLASLVALPLTGDDPQRANHPLFTAYLLLAGFFFFGWFWTHGGQTLGMRVWRLQVVRRDTGGAITGWQALVRYLIAIVSWLALGAGFLWSLFDKDRRTWHDIFSGTMLVVPPKQTRE